MRAVLMTATGDADVLQPGELPAPCKLKPDEVLIRLRGAGVNPIDTKLRRSGLYFPDGMPAVLGCDGAGIVEKIGAQVTDFAPGDAVYYCYGGLGKTPGNYAEFNIVPAVAVAHKPTALDFATAAAAPLVLITAWEALFDRAGMQAGQKVFIHAGAGGVGHVAVQLAKNAGCAVAASVSCEEKAQLARALGADHIINYREQDVAGELLAWSDGQGVDIAFDTVGGDAFRQLVAAVRIYGDLVTILQVPEDCDWKTLRLRNIRVSQELMLTPMVCDLAGGLAHHADILRRCAQQFDAGHLHIELARRLPLEKAADAHRLLEAGGFSGKITLEIQGASNLPPTGGRSTC